VIHAHSFLESPVIGNFKFFAVEVVGLWDERSLLVPSSKSGKSIALLSCAGYGALGATAAWLP
jgi:hypothetical protein